MGELDRYSPTTGAIEKFGMTTAITDEMDRNFANRGAQMGVLLVATLTETPYTPNFNGHTYGIEVSNIPAGGGPDTVVEAQEALAEGVRARVPGMSNKPVLDTFKTKYDDIASELEPTRRDGERNRKSFEEAFVENVHFQGVQIPSVEAGHFIVRHAPKRLTGLVLTSYQPNYTDTTAHNDMVTTDGHIVTVTTMKRYGFGGSYYNMYLPTRAQDRGGKAPRARITHDIKDRIVGLRTKGSRR